MPGLTLWMGLPTAAQDAPDSAFERRLAASQQGMRQGPEDVAEILVRAPGLRVGCVRYPGYPVELREAGDLRLVFEGHVYNRPRESCLDELAEIAAASLRGESTAEERLGAFIRGARGEYVAVAALVDGSACLVLSDPLGRLPLFFHAADHELLVSRECKFIAGMRPELDFDRLGFAQILYHGYPLGDRTLIRGVRRAPTGAFIRAQRNASGPLVEVRSLYVLDVAAKDDPGPSLDDCASELADLFVAACRETAELHGDSRTVLSLSGGQDSRAIASALVRAGRRPQTVTYLDAGDVFRSDSEVAGDLARALGLPWELFRLAPATPEGVLRLAQMKDGLNNVVMAWLLPFLSAVSERWGRDALYVTGDGGDKALPDLRKHGVLAGEEELVESIAQDHGRLPPAFVEDLLGLESGCLLDEVRKTVASYPEPGPTDRYVHFVIAERARRRLFEGEDRARFFLWESSPFYSLDFFERAMRVPDDLKSSYRLFARFQTLLSEQAAAIPDAMHRFPVDSVLFRMRRRLAGKLAYMPVPVQRLVRRYRGQTGTRLDADQLSLLRRLRGVAPDFERLLSPDATGEIRAHYHREVFGSYWTLVQTIRLRCLGADSPL